MTEVCRTLEVLRICCISSSVFAVLLQDIADLSINTVQGYMLPWDVRRLVAALCNLLAPEQRSYGFQEPSLFGTARCTKPLTDCQQSLLCEVLLMLAFLVVPSWTSLCSVKLMCAVVKQLDAALY